MTNSINKEGFFNRKSISLPKQKTIIDIIVTRVGGEEVYNAIGFLSTKKDYSKDNQPNIGFLGTSIVISGKDKGIGFQAWDQNDSEFIYYKISEEYRILERTYWN